MYGKTTQDINVSVTPLLQLHPMVLVLVLTDVLIVLYPLPLGFNGAFYVSAYLRPVSQRLCCWMDFSFVAPGTHDQMVCFLIFGRRGVWQPVQRQQAYLEFAVAHLVLAERWPEDVGR